MAIKYSNTQVKHECGTKGRKEEEERKKEKNGPKLFIFLCSLLDERERESDQVFFLILSHSFPFSSRQTGKLDSSLEDHGNRLHGCKLAELRQEWKEGKFG